MKRILVVAVALLLSCMTAVPAIAGADFHFEGWTDSSFDSVFGVVGVGFSGNFALQITTSGAPGTWVDTSVIPNETVLYYDPTQINAATLSLNGLFYDIATQVDLPQTSLIDTITDPLYVAWDQTTGTLGVGIYNAGLPFDAVSALAGEFITIFGAFDPSYDMASPWPTTATAGGALFPSDTVNGAVLHLAASGPMTIELGGFNSVDTYGVPEPSMFLLFGAGLAGLGVLRRKF